MRIVVTVLTTIVALTGGVGAALIGAWATLRARRPRKSMLELVDVSLPPPGQSTTGAKDHTPVLDVKVRNTGGQPAVLKRLVVRVHRAVRCGSMFSSMRLTPYNAWWAGASLPVSETYDVTLPVAEQAVNARVVIDLSQVVEPARADRFLVRLGMERTFDTLAYLLHLEMRYDGNDRTLTLPPLAVAFPQSRFVYSAEEIRDQIHQYQQAVNEIRQAIDREMAACGLPAPDWTAAPPRHRGDLPDGLLSVDGIGDFGFYSGGDGVYEVTDNFWDPQRTIQRYLHAFEQAYRELVEVGAAATVLADALRAELPRAQATLTQLHALHAEFRTAEKPITAAPPTSEGAPQAAEQPARLVARLLDGKGGLDELRARVNAGDEGTIRFMDQLLARRDLLEKFVILHTRSPHILRVVDLLEDRLRARGFHDSGTLAARRDLANLRGRVDVAGAATALAELLEDQRRTLGPDHPDLRAVRLELASWRTKAEDAAGAAEVFADIVEDHRQTLGPDHPNTLIARHNLAFWRGQAGSTDGAIVVFTELLEDMQRVLGPDDPRTLDVRHELARWHGERGDAAGAAAAFAELVPDRIRVQGPDHPRTLLSRHNLARWRGEAGDAPGAATAFAELVDDRRRVLGAHHPDTRKSEHALAHWREQAARKGSEPA